MPAPEAEMVLGCALAMLLLLDPARPASGPQAAPSVRRSADRASALAMFARAYYPGRSGQIAVVPKEGEFITRRGTGFMHGSPWDYDVRIPFLLWGPGRVRKGVFEVPVAQQDMAPTLARMLGVMLRSSPARVHRGPCCCWSSTACARTTSIGSLPTCPR
jgi:hypothetical protein